MLDNLQQMIEEPNINVGKAEHFINGHAGFDGIPNIENPLGPRRAQFRSDLIEIRLLLGSPKVPIITAQAEGTNF